MVRREGNAKVSNGPVAWRVIVNDEQQQHTFFPNLLGLPGGWRDAGLAGAEAERTAYVDTQWTSLRPRNLGDAMAESP